MKRRSVLAGAWGNCGGRALRYASILRAQTTIALNGRRAVQRRPRLYQGIGQVRRAGPEVLRNPSLSRLHKNSSLGLEKQYFEYMSQVKAVDYGIVSRLTCRPSPSGAVYRCPVVFKASNI